MRTGSSGFRAASGNAWNLEDKYCDATASPYPETSPCFDGFDSLRRLRTSYGAGLRWFSPLGPLRFEWGFPFDPLPYEEDMVFESRERCRLSSRPRECVWRPLVA